MSLIFLESLCDDPATIAANVELKVSQGDPDYKDMSPDDARKDFLRRISEYEKVYETITEPHLSYLRITNVGEEVTMSRINGYLSSRIAFYLMNLHIRPRNIFFSRVCIYSIFVLWLKTPYLSFVLSTGKASITLKARLVETHCYHLVGCNMQKPFLLSSPTTLGINHWLWEISRFHETHFNFDPRSGLPRSNELYKPLNTFLTPSSPGNPSMNWTPACVMVWHTRKSRSVEFSFLYISYLSELPLSSVSRRLRQSGRGQVQLSVSWRRVLSWCCGSTRACHYGIRETGKYSHYRTSG